MGTLNKKMITITEDAQVKIKEVLEDETPETRLRMYVTGGGCSGFQYGFDFDSNYGDDDIIFNENGAELVIDKVSIMYLNGSVVDFEDKLIESSFKVNNPNAASSCGCGTSFAPKQ